MDLRPHIEKFSQRFAEIEAALSDPKVFDNQQRAQDMAREYAGLRELVAQGQAYLKTVADLEENRALLASETSDTELYAMAKEEVRLWLETLGHSNLYEFLERIRLGDGFVEIYEE